MKPLGLEKSYPPSGIMPAPVSEKEFAMRNTTMKTQDITNYIQKMEQLIRMQQIELDKTRNLLGRVIDAGGRGEITCDKKEYNVADEIEFKGSVYPTRIIIHGVNCTSLGMKSDYERIIELKKELNL